MKDLQAQLRKLRADAAECKLISDLATDGQKRELFARLGEHLSILADEIEAVLGTVGSDLTQATKRRPA
jgi:hypothetical protein